MSFKWFQNNSTVTISFAVSATVKKQEIDVHITNSAIRAGTKGSPAVCEGQLCSPIKSSKWALKSNMVVIHLEKVTKGKWPSLFVGPQSAKTYVRVIYDYDATDPIELTIREGEVISVLNQDPSGWWKGETNGKVGLFPHNFVEPLPADGVEPPEDMTESASSVQEEEAQEQAPVPAVSLPQFQPPITSQVQPIQPQPSQLPQAPQTAPQPTASTGTDEGRPRVPVMSGALSMDELKNKLKKRAGGDEPAAPGSAPVVPSVTGSRLFNRAQQGAGDATEPTPSSSKIFGRSTSSDSAAGENPTGSRIFSRPPLASSTEGAPTAGSRLFSRPAASPEPTNPSEASTTPAPTSTGVSRLKFGNKGSSLALGAIAAGAIASNTERQPVVKETKEPSLDNILPPPPEPISDAEIVLPKPPGTCVRAVYEYEAVDEGEIGFTEGTEIDVLVRDGSGWWQGKLPTGQVGWFPANFVEEISLPPPVLPEETVEEKLQKVASTSARLATPRRAAGNSNRRKPTKQKKTIDTQPAITSVPVTPSASAPEPKPSRPISRLIPTPLNPVPVTTPPTSVPTNSTPLEEPKARPKPAPRRNVPQQDSPSDQNFPNTTSPPPTLSASTLPTPAPISTASAPPTSSTPPQTNPIPKVPAPVARKLVPKAAARPLSTVIAKEQEEKPGITPEKLPKAVPVPAPVTASSKERAATKWPAQHGTFTDFCSELSSLCSTNKGLSIGLCTVDGATFSCGENSFQTLQGCAFPFVYAFAARELGRAEMQKLVLFEPVVESEANILPTGLPKALSKAGMLVVLGAMLARGSWGIDGRSRVEKLLDLFGQASGGLRVQSSLSSFLSLRDTSHQDYALAHGLKAASQLPTTVNIGDLLDLYFAARSIEVDCQFSATLAAIFASEGVTPQNNQKVLEPPVARAILELFTPITPEVPSVLGTAAPGTSTILLFVPKVGGIALRASSDQQAQGIAKIIAQKLHS